MEINGHFIFSLFGSIIAGFTSGQFLNTGDYMWLIGTMLGVILAIHAGYNYFAKRNYPFY